MIPITINKKKYKIKAIDELTTAEFIELSKMKEVDTVKYIAWQTGQSFNDAFFAVTSLTLDKAIGTIKDITKLPVQVVPYLNYKKNIETVGQRYQIETSNIQGLELLPFCLAVAQANDSDITKVKLLVKYYNKKPWREILPAGFFFFNQYRNGKSRGQNFSMRLLHLIRIKKYGSKRALLT